MFLFIVIFCHWLVDGFAIAVFLILFMFFPPRAGAFLASLFSLFAEAPGRRDHVIGLRVMDSVRLPAQPATFEEAVQRVGSDPLTEFRARGDGLKIIRASAAALVNAE